MPTTHALFARPKPIGGRFWVWLLLPAAAGAEPLTEDVAVGLALRRPAVEARARAEVDLAESEATSEGVWPNPVVSFTREETRGGRAASQRDAVWIEQALDLSGRRGLRSDAALGRAAAVSEYGHASKLDLESAVRTRFADLLAVQGRVAALEARLGPMERIAETVARREAAGDVSGYDRRRLDRERASARARLETEMAARDGAWERLAGMLGGTVPRPAGSALVAGEILPNDPPSLGSLLPRIERRPDLRALVREREAGDLEARAGARGWIPEVVLGGGFMRADGLDGFLVVASLALPIFDRRQADSERGEARARRASAQASISRAEAEGEIRALHAEATRLSGSARRFRAEAVALSADLVRTAETAYAAGELGILELLDAHRGALDRAVGGSR